VSERASNIGVFGPFHKRGCASIHEVIGRPDPISLEDLADAPASRTDISHRARTMLHVADRVERLTELMMLLLDTSMSLTFDDIVQRADLYGDRSESSRKSFERDKSSLRSMGIRITTEVAEGDRGATRYTIRPQDYFLPDLDLSEAERMALHLGASMVRLDVAWDEAALVKLGGASPVPLAPVVAEMASLDQLPVLHSAMQARSPVTFNYSGRKRVVQGHGMFYREGNWYLSGDDGEAVKIFRIDRIEGGVKPGEPGSYEPPGRFDAVAAMPDDPMLIGGGDPSTASVLIDSVMAGRVERLRGGGVIERRDDGSVVFEIEVRNLDAFRSWLFGLRDHAVVLGPAHVVEDVVAWLTSIVDAGEHI